MLVLLGGVATFVLVASIVQPERSSARVAPSELAGGSATGSGGGATGSAFRGGSTAGGVLARRAAAVNSEHLQGWKLLGSFIGIEYRLLAYTSPDGPRYTVAAVDGRVLQADLSADEVYQVFPQLDVKSLRLEPGAADEGSALMLLTWPED